MRDFMKHFERHRSFYKMMIAITIPIAMQNLIIFSVSMMDTLMLGQVGSAQLSACAQANQPAFIFNLFVFGLASGGAVLTAQYWGKNNIERVNRVIGIVLRITIVISIILTILVILFPNQIMLFYLKNKTAEDKYILSEAVSYLRIVGLSYFFWGISLAFSCILRSVEIVKISVVASLISCVSNIFFNWIFIFGKFGIAPMGIKGAATGTLIARIIECIIICIYIFGFDKRISFNIKYIINKDTQLFKDYLKYSSPVVANELAWSAAISIQAAILGKLSNQILAANSISMVLQQLAMIISIGIANAGAVVIGKRIGQGDIQGARKDGALLMNWSIIIGSIGMIMVLLLRKPFASLYTKVDTATKLLAQDQMIIVAVIVLFATINCCSIVGVLRGAGDTKFAMKVEMIALWLIALPAGLICGFVIKAPILVTFSFLKIDEFIKSFIGFIRTKQAKAYRSVTRE